jgi:hypothetical protein
MLEVPGAGTASDKNGDPAPCYDFGADSASNRNEYQESYWRSWVRKNDGYEKTIDTG